MCYWGAIFNCMKCDANKDALNGSPEMLSLCKCEANIWIWYLVSLGSVTVEMVVWKPWTRCRSWCSFTSWKIGLAVSIPSLVTVCNFNSCNVNSNFYPLTYVSNFNSCNVNSNFYPLAGCGDYERVDAGRGCIIALLLPRWIHRICC